MGPVLKTIESPLPAVLADVRRLLRTQHFAVLATSGATAPLASIIAFAPVDDGAGLVFLTPRDSAKYRNIEKNPNVSLVIDERPGSGGGIEGACGITVTGTIRAGARGETGRASEAFFGRHRRFRRYMKEKDVVLLRIDVNTYLHTRGLASVTAVDPRFLKRSRSPAERKARP
jgi:hypothetical protein